MLLFRTENEPKFCLLCHVLITESSQLLKQFHLKLNMLITWKSILSNQTKLQTLVQKSAPSYTEHVFLILHNYQQIAEVPLQEKYYCWTASKEF